MCQNTIGDSAIERSVETSFMAHNGQFKKRLGTESRHLERHFFRGRICAAASALLLLFVVTNFTNAQVGSSVKSQFRSPQIPASNSVLEQPTDQSGNLMIQDLGQSETLPGQTILNPPMPAAQDTFVPRETTPSGFVPVRPQDAIDAMPTDADDVIGEFQLDVPSRSKDDEEILSLLRSERIDEAVQATRNKDGSELVKQFYPDGKVQIERYVAQDEKGNFFNHGSWKLFNRRGQVMAKGNFEDGMMSGSWERWHPANSSGMFQSAPFNEYKGPFISTATFKDGKLDGVWAIFDQFQRKIAEIPYKAGLRHGTATWKFPDSSNMRIARFTAGKMDGPLYEWDRQSKLVRNDEYIKGKRVIKNVTFYRPKQRKSENYFLEGQYELEGDDSWWDAKPAEYVQTGSRTQHGPSYVWHENGQVKMRGSYQNNEPVGTFTWWHSNGQRELTGSYRGGLKSGKWTGWHANGMKSFEGQFEEDERSGKWRWWDEDGKVRSEKDFDQPEESTDVLKKPKPKTEDDSTESETKEQAVEAPAMEDYSDAEEITPAESENFRPGEYPDAESSENAETENSSENAGPEFRDPTGIYGKDPFGEGESKDENATGSGSGT